MLSDHGSENFALPQRKITQIVNKQSIKMSPCYSRITYGQNDGRTGERERGWGEGIGDAE